MTLVLIWTLQNIIEDKQVAGIQHGSVYLHIYIYIYLICGVYSFINAMWNKIDLKQCLWKST